MIQASITKEFSCDKNILWDIITNNQNYHWRSDLSKIDIIDSTHFIEYDKHNYPTYFTITAKEKLKKYQFKIENTNLKGTWVGTFKKLPNGNIQINFKEEIIVSNIIMRLLAKSYLKKQQKRYIKDLEYEIQNKKLSEI